MLKRESSTVVFSFLHFFSLIYLFYFFVLDSVAVNQKASTETDVMRNIEIDGVLKYVSDEIGAWNRGKIYEKIN